MIDSQNSAHTQPLGSGDHSGIGQTQIETAILPDRLPAAMQIRRGQLRYREKALCQAAEECQFSVHPEILPRQIVDFGQNGARDNDRLSTGLDEGPYGSVMPIIYVVQGIKCTRVGDDRYDRRAIISPSNSSARSDTSDRPLRKAPAPGIERSGGGVLRR